MPSTLGLAVNPLVLGPFIPGVAQTYTGTTTATVTSSWPNATLSVYDEDANTNTNGRLVNGASIIPGRLEVLNSTGAYQSIQAPNQGSVRSRPGRQRWPAPPATITMRQAIANTNVLVAGEYAQDADVLAVHHDAVSQ